jgi:hypothetical protein
MDRNAMERPPVLTEENQRDRFTGVFGGLPTRFVFKSPDGMNIRVRGSVSDETLAKGRLYCTEPGCYHPPVEFAVRDREMAIEFPWVPLRGWKVTWPTGDVMPTVKCPRHGGEA